MATEVQKTETAPEKSENRDLYVIQKSKLVLDVAGEQKVAATKFAGSKTQLWKFQNGSRPGLYVIINEQHGKVLDLILSDDDGSLQVGVSDMKNNCLRQQWNVSLRGRIVNAASGQVLAIDGNGGRVSMCQDIRVEECKSDSSQELLIEKSENVKVGGTYDIWS